MESILVNESRSVIISYCMILLLLTFTILNQYSLAQVDTTPPELINLEVTPQMVDTSMGSATIHILIEAQDDISGFGGGTGTGNGSIDIRSLSGQPVGRGSLPITGGDNLNPIFEFDLTFPQFSEAGTWNISLVLIDNVFNDSRFSSQDLANLGFPSTINVTSVVDNTPPDLIDFQVDPQVVNTTSSDATIHVRIQARDPFKGDITLMYEDIGSETIKTVKGLITSKIY